MRNIKLVLEYDGSRYDGWQRLGRGESSNTLENRLQGVLNRMTEEEIELNCGARTEAGVHAYGQVVNFKTASPMKLYEIKHYCNRYLPMDMAVLEVEEMPERFHAALNAEEKTFVYRIAVGESAPVFERKYIYYSFDRPDEGKMKEAADLLLGKQDFKNFSTVKKSKSTVKELRKLQIDSDGDEIQIIMTANDFLHNMPKLIAGTLLEIGLGRLGADKIPDIFAGTVPAGPMAAANGLFLQKITYKSQEV